MHFDKWFHGVTGFDSLPWQRNLGEQSACVDRLIRIPTGFGKTAGTVLTWVYHRVLRGDDAWPLRLVFCLPMRVLVEQTERAIQEWLAKARLGEIAVTTLLGGRHESDWLGRPERPSIIVGTQDMLISRALGRGYGAARGLWPMEMGLLHRDALWVADEIQLMDVGLATTAQLHAFRHDDERRKDAVARRTFTWWMSATLQRSWLNTVDFETCVHDLPMVRIEAVQRLDGLWKNGKALERRADVVSPEEIAALVKARHGSGLTLVIVNTVEQAKKIEFALAKSKMGADVRLVHSQFRGWERARWDFLQRHSVLPPGGRVVVATQVVEAGVDISAELLVVELAPWSSLVQRFGRCARYAGEAGQVVVVGAAVDEKKALPYRLEELKASNEALQRCADVGPASLEAFEEGLSSDARAKLYPYEPLHVLRRPDFDDLFDTTADLSGADLDVSRYIRSGEERDVSVFWRDLGNVSPKTLGDVAAPLREELCPVPLGDLRTFLKGKVGYVRDYVTGRWNRVDRIVPGMTVLLPAAAGGYAVHQGWDPKSTDGVTPVTLASAPEESPSKAAASADDDDLSVATWKTIATHGRETGELALSIGRSLGLSESVLRILSLAGRWHDAGKGHGTFQDAIAEEARGKAAIGARRDLAKAPKDAWRKPAYPERPGFRHELASTLMLFEVLRRACPEHVALGAAHRELLSRLGRPIEVVRGDEPLVHHPLAEEIAALSGDEFDLLAYLVCAHHGKVRTSWSSTPRDQEAEHGGIHGICSGDQVETVSLCGADGSKHPLPPVTLSLVCAEMGLNGRYGASWGERVAGLVARFGPISLAYLEAVFRSADWRASALATGEDA